MTQKSPLVVVLGATACGKSRLAIELANRFKGEIISADSMQVYKGLDIVTNKVTEEEQRQAQHHMINFLDPSSRYSVIDFRNKSLELIDRLHKQAFLPIIVGGTNYYIESLLWKSFIVGPTLESAKRAFLEPSNTTQEDGTLIDTEAKVLKKQSHESLHTTEDLEDVDKFFSKPIFNDGLSKFDSQKLWKILEQVDPKSAHYFHPHDRRRIIRSLQICQERNKSYSDLLLDINKSELGDKHLLGGPLRYENTLVIWLHCDRAILDKILDERVDKMLERGLLDELKQFHIDYNMQRMIDKQEPEYDKGIFQTIGFKEFHEYLMLSSEDRDSREGKEILDKSIARMKISTRQYAKRQLKWIRRRFLQDGTRDLPPVFMLTVENNEEGWQEKVRQPAFDIVSCHLNKIPFPDDLLIHRKNPEKQELVNKPGRHYCEVCDRTFIGTVNIDAHLSSRIHERNVVRSKRQKKEEIVKNSV